MNLDYELFLEHSVVEEAKRIRGKARNRILEFVNSLVEDPFRSSAIEFVDRKGRAVVKSTVLNYSLTYSIDHAMKEIKVLELNKII